MTADLGGLALLNALFLAAGCGVTGAAGFWRGRRGLAGSLGVSYLAGVASFGVVAQLLYVCGASPSRVQVVAVCAVLASGAVRGLRGEAVPRERRRDALRLAVLPLAAFVALIAVDLWFQPLWTYDAWTFWTPKAHALWALGGLDAGWFTQGDLLNRDYPLLLPAVEAAGFRFTGYETGLLDLQSLLFLVAFLRAVYELSAGRTRSLVLWAVLAMLVVAPSVVDELAAAEADIPVATLFAVAGACGAVWLLERRRGALPVAAVLAAGASATKIEGLEFTIALFAVLTVLAGGRRLEPVLAGAAAIAVGVVPWRLWIHLHHVPNQSSLGRVTDLGYLASHAGRVPLVVGYLLVKLLDPRAWLLLLPLFAVALWGARRDDRELAVYAVAVAVLSFLGLVLAYWTTPFPLHYHLATSARRVVTAIVFFGAALTPLLAGVERRQGSLPSAA